MHLNFNRVGGRYCKGLAKISEDFFCTTTDCVTANNDKGFQADFPRTFEKTSQVWLRIKALKIECDLKF